MAKPEWGKKRNCPECGARFYDLGKDDPVTCIECGYEWVPEPVLKSKQPIPEEEAKTPEAEEEDLVDIEVDVEGDDDFTLDDDGDEVPAVVKPTKDDEGE